MVLEFIGADREVTGSCHYLTFGDTHILIDCGMEQGADLYVYLNKIIFLSLRSLKI